MTFPGAAELRDPQELAAACGGDALVEWAVQTMRAGVRAWAAAGGVAVASPALSNRDRLVVHGPVGPVASLVALALSCMGPSYRVVGPATLVAGVAQRVPELEVSGTFAWMETNHGAPPPPTDHTGGASWLDPADGPEVTEILQSVLPESHARPGVAGVRRWAGIRSSGRLASVAADAWSTSAVGFVSGVATRPHLQGRGLGRAVVRFLVSAMRRDHARVGLFVDAANAPAIALYRSLGMSLRPVASAAVRDVPPGPC